MSLPVSVIPVSDPQFVSPCLDPVEMHEVCLLPGGCSQFFRAELARRHPHMELISDSTVVGFTADHKAMMRSCS